MTCGNPGICDRITGHCSGGCRAGWTGLLCDEGKSLVIYMFICMCMFLLSMPGCFIFKKNTHIYIYF